MYLLLHLIVSFNVISVKKKCPNCKKVEPSTEPASCRAVLPCRSTFPTGQLCCKKKTWRTVWFKQNGLKPFVLIATKHIWIHVNSALIYLMRKWYSGIIPEPNMLCHQLLFRWKNNKHHLKIQLRGETSPHWKFQSTFKNFFFSNFFM